MAKPVKHGEKWRIRPLDESGKRLSLTFDSYKEADHELKKIEVLVEEKKRGKILSTMNDNPNLSSLLADLRKEFGRSIVEGKTFEDLFEYWIGNRVPQKRSGREDVSIIRAHLRPAFGKLLLSEFRVEHVDEFKNQRRHLEKQTVKNHLTLLISLLKVGVELNWIDEQKRPKIKKPKVHAPDFRYLKTQDEIDQFLMAARDHSEYAFAIYATAIFTGMRLGEIAALEKSSVNFEQRLIIVKKSHQTTTKSGRIRFVPIGISLLPILKTWFLNCPGPLVFPNRDGNLHGKFSRIFDQTFHAVLDKAGFPKIQVKGKERFYIRFHDLRHTFASHWMMSGGCIFKLQKILGHQSPETTQRYAHLSPDAFSSDYDRVGSNIQDGSVLQFKARG